MQELRRIYREGLSAHIEALETARSRGDSEAQASILRVAHMLRGSGATYGFVEVSEAARAVEQAEGTELLDMHVDRLIALLRQTAAGAG
jgi:HPt (histidine-containing phosphotransfer) domain-containing protein